MLTYVLIGIGGAIGSILRAWLGTAVVALTGASFPWGTILINVVGSFVIGFFGTLTATDGRFAVPFDMRAFVMVGICGGFTTFSSFSLQTLELAHDGRASQALGNVALSVVLCLGSVAAGYALASSIRTSSLAAIGEATPGTLGSRTLMALHRPDSVPAMLDVAGKLMTAEGGRTTVLAIDGPILAALQPTAEVMTAARRNQLSGQRADWVSAMRKTLDRWVTQQKSEGHQARWVAIAGDGAMAVAEHGRGAHLLILEQDQDDRQARARMHAALAQAGRPVLLVPAKLLGTFGRVIAVAWQDDANVARAVQSAEPLLAQAERVVVLRIGAEERHDSLPALFDKLPVNNLTAPPDGKDVGVQLMSMAHQAGADLLVMGSYSHGRLRERLLDGVTESVVACADMPVFMQHQDA